MSVRHNASAVCTLQVTVFHYHRRTFPIMDLKGEKNFTFAVFQSLVGCLPRRHIKIDILTQFLCSVSISKRCLGRFQTGGWILTVGICSCMQNDKIYYGVFAYGKRMQRYSIKQRDLTASASSFVSQL